MSKLPKIFIIVFVFFCKSLIAQDFPYFYFSNFNPMVNNPAFIAAENDMTLDVGSYNLWAGGFKPLNDYMISFSISPDIEFKKHKRKSGFEKKIGLGLIFLRENFGAFTQNVVQLGYSYHIPISKKNFLSLGIAVAGENLNIDVGSLNPLNEDDPRLLSGNNNSVLFDGSFGAAIHAADYTVSFSVTNLASDDFKFDNDLAKEINNYTKYYFTADYNFEISQDISFLPKVVVRNSRMKKMNFDYSAAFDFKQFVVGLGYRTKNSLFIFTKIPVKNFFFTYTSENPVKSNHMIGNGHTFTIGWNFNSPQL
jgi:type IX secretion system PorP/SprF family membrane protein